MCLLGTQVKYKLQSEWHVCQGAEVGELNKSYVYSSWAQAVSSHRIIITMTILPRQNKDVGLVPNFMICHNWSRLSKLGQLLASP